MKIEDYIAFEPSPSSPETNPKQIEESKIKS